MWLLYYFNLERNYDVLKSKSLCFLLNKNKNSNKNHTHVKKVGHSSKFLFGIYWWTWKIFIKHLLKWANKKLRILIFTMLHFLKNKEKHLKISLFYTCVPKFLMIWSAVPEIGNFGRFFLPFYPSNDLRNQNFEKLKKQPERSSFYTCTKNHDHRLYRSWNMAHDECNFYFLF